MHRHLLSYAFLTAAMLAPFAPTAMADPITFDSSADLAKFNLTGDASSTFHVTTSGGVGGSGGVSSSSTDYNGTAAIYNAGITPTIGQSMFVSLDYRALFPNNGPDVRVGFTMSAFGSFPIDSSDVFVETSGNSSSKSFQTLGLANATGSVNIIAGDWYRIRLDLTETSANNFSTTASFYAIGHDGTSSPILLRTLNSNFVSSMFATSPLYGGFFLLNQTTAADNFNASEIPALAPEPASLAMLALGLGGVGIAARRRKRAV